MGPVFTSHHLSEILDDFLEPETERSFSSRVFFSDQDHSLRLLQVGAELIQEPRGQFVVDQAPVAGQRDGHQLLGAQGLVVLVQPQLRPGGPHGQDARLRRVNDGAEAADAEHPQVRYAAAGTTREWEGEERRH